jgi:hypothetical protein
MQTFRESGLNIDTYRQFRDLSDPIATFKGLFRAALESLLPDLADAPWYVRERDVVNLFDRGQVLEKNGSSGRTRTYNPPVNSRMLCH